MRKGIDVSKHQGVINWDSVKASGVEFAIIRAGYGRDTVDAYFVRNIEECIRLDISVGVYWFIYGVNESEAVQNADKFHETILPYKEKIIMKAWCDFEYDTDRNANKRGVIFDRKTRTNMVIAFCERMKSYGYEVGNYANPDYLIGKFNDLSQYPLWLAWYNATENSAKKYNPEIWQYTSGGTVPGINGNVDMNYYYGEIKKKEEVKEELQAEVVSDGKNVIYSYSKSKEGNEKLSKNFKVKEFACKDSSDPVFIAPELVVILQEIRDHYGKAVHINSAYRTPSYNKKVDGATYSQHLYGTAADIRITGVKPNDIAAYAETLLLDRGGIGIYNNFVHIDVRGEKARWNG